MPKYFPHADIDRRSAENARSETRCLWRGGLATRSKGFFRTKVKAVGRRAGESDPTGDHIAETNRPRPHRHVFCRMRTSKSRLSKRTEHGPTDTYFAGCGPKSRMAPFPHATLPKRQGHFVRRRRTRPRPELKISHFWSNARCDIAPTYHGTVAHGPCATASSGCRPPSHRGSLLRNCEFSEFAHGQCPGALRAPVTLRTDIPT